MQTPPLFVEVAYVRACHRLRGKFVEIRDNVYIHQLIPSNMLMDAAVKRDSFYKAIGEHGFTLRDVSSAVFRSYLRSVEADVASASGLSGPIDHERFQPLPLLYDVPFLRDTLDRCIETGDAVMLVHLLDIARRRRTAAVLLLARPQSDSALQAAWARRMERMFELIASAPDHLLACLSPALDRVAPGHWKLGAETRSPPCELPPMTLADRFIYYAVADALDWDAYFNGHMPPAAARWMHERLDAHLPPHVGRDLLRQLLAIGFADPDDDVARMMPRELSEGYAWMRSRNDPLEVRAFAMRLMIPHLRAYPELNTYVFCTNPEYRTGGSVVGPLVGLSYAYGHMFRRIQTNLGHSAHGGLVFRIKGGVAHAHGSNFQSALNVWEHADESFGVTVLVSPYGEFTHHLERCGIDTFVDATSCTCVMPIEDRPRVVPLTATPEARSRLVRALIVAPGDPLHMPDVGFALRRVGLQSMAVDIGRLIKTERRARDNDGENRVSIVALHQSLVIYGPGAIFSHAISGLATASRALTFLIAPHKALSQMLLHEAVAGLDDASRVESVLSQMPPVVETYTFDCADGRSRRVAN